MPRIRLLLATLPPLLRDIVDDALADEREVVVMAGDGDEDLAAAVARLRIDVVLLEDHGSALPDEHLRLMYGNPRLQLLTLSGDGRRAALYRLVPERRVIADVSPGGLAAAVRALARRGAEA